jgi:hypothetical protein
MPAVDDQDVGLDADNFTPVLLDFLMDVIMRIDGIDSGGGIAWEAVRELFRQHAGESAGID